jgi:hypothetical protein
MKKLSYVFLIMMGVIAQLPLDCYAAQTVVLGSGKSVELISGGPIFFAQGKPSALMLKYRTTVPIDDLVALRKEVDEIWDRFVVDAERGGYQQAVISATGPEKGFIITSSKSYNFVFLKQNGTWRTLEAVLKPQEKLNEKVVKDFVDRVDCLRKQKELNAFMLYIANDWIGTVASPSGPVTFNRVQLAQVNHQNFSKVKDYQHQRKILKITISPDGTSAQIDSEETEQGIVDNKEIKTTSVGMDLIEVKDENMLFTKSTSLDKR